MDDDVAAQATIFVNIQGVSGLQRLAAMLARIKREAGGAAPRPQAAMSQAQLDRMAHPIAVGIAEKISYAVGYSLRAPFDAIVASGRVVGRSLLSLTGSLGHFATNVGLVSFGIVALGGAVTGLASPLLNLVGGFKILREAFGWAETAAAEQIRVAGRTRRFFPQILGEGVEAAELAMRVRMASATALFGNAADAMQENITRKMSEYRLGRGIRGEKDIFERWGITPERLARFEQMTGSRVDLTTWLRLFVIKREELEKQLESASPAEKLVIRRKLAMLADDTVKIFGQKFADTVGAMNNQDLAKLETNMKEAVRLGEVPDATRRSINFTIALESLKATFSAITLGIGGDVQPTITKFLNELRHKLTDVDASGKSLGMSFRELASSMATKTWETLRDVMAEITPQTLSGWIAEVNKWNPHDSAESIKGFLHAFVSFTKAVGRIIEVVGEYFGTSEAPAEGGAPAAAAPPAAPPPAAAPGPPPAPPATPPPEPSGRFGWGAPITSPTAPTMPTAPATGAPAAPSGTGWTAPAAAPPPSTPAPLAFPPPTGQRATYPQTGSWAQPFGIQPQEPQKQINLDTLKTAAAGRALVTSTNVVSGPSGDTLVMKSKATDLRPEGAQQGRFGYSVGGWGVGGSGVGPPAIGATGEPAVGAVAPSITAPMPEVGVTRQGIGTSQVPGAPSLYGLPPSIGGFGGGSALTRQDGTVFGAAAAEALKDGLDGASISQGTAPTSYGVAPRAAPKPTGGDTASES